LNDHAKLFIRESDVASAQAKVIKSLAYKYQITDQYNLVNMKRTLGGYSLHSEILQLRYDSCASRENGNLALKNKKISSGQFNRHRANLTVQWKLMADDDKEAIFKTRTTGISDSWLLNSKGNKILSLAMEDAVTQLFSKQEFIDKITAEAETDSIFSTIFSLMGSSDENQQTEDIDAGSLQAYQMQAYSAQTLSEMSSVKMMMMEHYFTTGNWPEDLADLGLSESMFQSSKTISHINIQADGSIIAELRNIMGKDKIIKLTPQGDSNNIGLNRWDCSSNIARGALVSACETFD
jgi:hypothetical protein